MVRLTRIYTKTGDDGTTSLGDGTRVRKTDLRIEAYAAVDELNSALGLASMFNNKRSIGLVIAKVQNDLFDVGADLCVPMTDNASKRIRITEDYIRDLEQEIDFYNDKLSPLESFVLPSGMPLAGVIHNARAISRRAERCVWAAMEEYGDDINELTAVYLNRLSDLLFVLARSANGGADVLWEPRKGRE